MTRFYFSPVQIFTENYRNILPFLDFSIQLSCEVIAMVKTKVGITLGDDTLAKLDKIMKALGLTRSQAIAYLINSYK